MKRVFGQMVIILCFQTAFAQIPSSCVVPSTLQTYYDADVKHLALKKIFANILPPDSILIQDRDSIIVPQDVPEPIWEGLAAIFNVTTIPERDSAFDIYCIHQVVSDNLFHSIYVAVDTSYAWTQQWQNLITTTGNVPLDNLLSTYGFSITAFSTFGSNYATLTTSHNINVRPLCDSIATYSGVLYSEPKPYAGDGNSITYLESGNDRIYYFTLGLGDCQSGCTEFHTYRFKVFPNCSVTYMGTFNSATYLPNPMNCNITSGINHVNTNTESRIFPNPAEDIINVETNYSPNANYKICNIYGQIVQTGIISEEKKIYVHGLNNGIYMLMLNKKTTNETANYKFVKK